MLYRFRARLGAVSLARLGAVILIGAASLALAASTPLKIAFVYVGPVSDGGWSQQHHLGKLAVEKALGPLVQTTYVESVPETADAERVLRDLAAKGYSLIFATSFGYMEPTLKVAKLFPQVRFEHATGYKTAANVVTYEARTYEGAYLLGVIAGRMSRNHNARVRRLLPDPGGDPQHRCLHPRRPERRAADSHAGRVGG